MGPSTDPLAHLPPPALPRLQPAVAARVAGLALAPFAMGWALFAPSDGEVHGAGLSVCPMRNVLGIPCPLCGATRAVGAAAHLDGAVWRYNAVWVCVLLGVAVLALVAALPRVGPPVAWGLRRLWGRPMLPGVLLLAAGWAWSLTHAAAILA